MTADVHGCGLFGEFDVGQTYFGGGPICRSLYFWLGEDRHGLRCEVFFQIFHIAACIN